MARLLGDVLWASWIYTFSSIELWAWNLSISSLLPNYTYSSNLLAHFYACIYKQIYTWLDIVIPCTHKLYLDTHTHTYTCTHTFFAFTPLSQQEDTYGHIRHTHNPWDNVFPSAYTVPYTPLIKHTHSLVHTYKMPSSTIIKSHINFQVLKVSGKFFKLYPWDWDCCLGKRRGRIFRRE